MGKKLGTDYAPPLWLKRFSAILVLLGLFIPGLMPLTAQADTVDSSSIINYLKSSGLPVGNVSLKAVPNAKGLVIYLPQVHQNPGSNVTDTSNNSAEQAQNQLYSIVSGLNKNQNVGFVMAEGDMYGPVPDAKIQSIKSKIDASSALTSEISALSSEIKTDSVDSSAESKILSDANKVLPQIARDIILKGAPYKYKAEGGNITLYGAENPTTYDACANLVRDYIYLEDRISQLSSGSYSSMGGYYTLPTVSQSTYQGGNLSSEISAAQAEAEAAGKASLEEIYQNMGSTINTLNAPDYVYSDGSPTPSRSDNPYASVTNIQSLKTKLQQDESQVQTMVINQRNQETSENMLKAMQATGQSVGILQFGAGHEDGLVPDLNKQGLSVLVVTANEVLASNGGQISSVPTVTPTMPAAPTPTANPMPTATSVPTASVVATSTNQLTGSTSSSQITTSQPSNYSRNPYQNYQGYSSYPTTSYPTSNYGSNYGSYSYPTAQTAPTGYSSGYRTMQPTDGYQSYSQMSGTPSSYSPSYYSQYSGQR